MVCWSREALVAARDDGTPKGPLMLASMETTAAVCLPMVRPRVAQNPVRMDLKNGKLPRGAMGQHRPSRRRARASSLIGH